MNVAVIGASGYVGAELVGLLLAHKKVSIKHLVVSENSTSSMLCFSELHARWQGICDLPLQPFSKNWLSQNSTKLDAVFLATPHEFSAQWAPVFLELEIHVFDLSGAYRLGNADSYPTYYGFEHPSPALLSQAIYGLAEWLTDSDIEKLSFQSQSKAVSPSKPCIKPTSSDETVKKTSDSLLVALPGCYPTASLLALKPLKQLQLITEDLVVINGISGVSGAGRSAHLANSFNEVSLRPYNILQHRHQPEISQALSTPVVFNPHLAPYKRGLLVTVTVKVPEGTSEAVINKAFHYAYDTKAMVRIKSTWPQIDDVAHTPFADIHWTFCQTSKVLVVAVAIDNLLKGAASQAVQCLNISLGLPSSYSLVPELAEEVAA